jgi:UDP-N-acetylglucosamine transferase subunit ALG13
MIFVTVGTTDRQFDRLIKEVDRLAKKENFIVQTGSSSYTPKNLTKTKSPKKGGEWFPFLKDTKIIESLNREADIIITHGGAGCISLALHYRRPLIVVPRLPEHGEHHTNHQLQLAEELESQGLSITVKDISMLEEAIKKARRLRPKPMKTNLEEAKKEIIKLSKNRKTCIAFNAGGHFTEAKPFLDLFPDSFYVVLKGDLIPGEIRKKKHYLVPDPNRLRGSLTNTIKSLWIILKERPKLFFSTGAGLAITLSYFAKILGAKIIYIESFAQTREKSMTGKFLYPIADLFYVRWKSLLEKYGKKAKYINYIY